MPLLSALVDQLPPHLAERVRLLGDAPLPRGGAAVDAGFVLYWMNHAVRGHENPALDAAEHAALALDVPLLVYQGLGGRHPYHNARHDAFILEGARDAAEELAARGVAHTLHLPDDPASPSPLPELAAHATLVVAEDFPAPPMPAWARRLHARAGSPIWLVDASCVVPMRSVPKAHDRAFRFRDATKRAFRAAVGRAYPERGGEPARMFHMEHLAARTGWTPADARTLDIEAAVLRRRVDHHVPPVAETRGGARAGYARWEAFRDGPLASYHTRRNNAADLGGVSRLSAYLHHGHVSVFRVAREAHAFGGEGAEKFLDELWVWRELAHNLCFHRSEDVETLRILPEWARRTLAAHEGDRREALLSWETMARGRTGDPLWDLAQRSLLLEGELHNNVRMTWAKAIVGWTPNAGEALRALIDLNHRYALDGSDANSYGGLLWALGLFDRPFEPESAVLGTVRSRPTSEHARRLDLAKYRRVVERGLGDEGRLGRVAVIGAGIAGLSAARMLADQGAEVVVFEKGRGPGGRTSTRRVEAPGVGSFDHGAPAFEVGDGRMGPWVESWVRDGVVARWAGRVRRLDGGGGGGGGVEGAWYVGTPGMNSAAKHLMGEVDARFGLRVAGLERERGCWSVRVEEGGAVAGFDAVVVTAPPTQAAELVRLHDASWAEAIASVGMSPCWAVMLAFDRELDAGFDLGVGDGSGVLDLAVREGSKPGRGAGSRWVAHASEAWSIAHLEDEAEEVCRSLGEAFAAAVGDASPAVYARAHRWRFARVSRGGLSGVGASAWGEGGAEGIVLAGDWVGGPGLSRSAGVRGVEAAFLSGQRAALRVVMRLRGR